MDNNVKISYFEIFCEPIVRSIARDHNLTVEKSAQNIYPDFTLYFNDKPRQRIAIEVKSTYWQHNNKGEIKKFSFTLGAYSATSTSLLSMLIFLIYNSIRLGEQSTQRKEIALRNSAISAPLR